MTDDFAGAAVRHFKDGDLLEKNGRISNADQLFGFAAECGIKSALITLPGCAISGDLHEKYHEHIDKLWDLAQLQSVQKRYKSLAFVLRKHSQFFSNWSTRQRYSREGAVSPETLSRHRTAATRVLGSVGLTGVRLKD